MSFPSSHPSRQIPDSSDWYAVYTRHQHEKKVAQALENKGFTTLLPLYQERRRWQDRMKILSLPLFPCYVFIKGSLKRRVEVLTTPGIYCFVLSGGEPAPIATAEITAVQRGIEAGLQLQPWPFLKSGDRVRVRSGSLEGIEGILVRKKNEYRLVLSVEILGKAASVEIDVGQVERVTTDRICAPVTLIPKYRSRCTNYLVPSVGKVAKDGMASLA